MAPTRMVATLIEAHWTDWKAPVSPSGLPRSTIIASVRTSVKARPRLMTVIRSAIRQYVGAPIRESATAATVASVHVSRK